jgi:hypothetical protein
MSIAELDTVDAFGFHPETGVFTLLISDHLDWGKPGVHLAILQDKVNAYLDFYDTGQAAESAPGYDFESLGIGISVLMRVPVPDSALPGLRALAAQLREIPCVLTVEDADGTVYDVS